MNSQSMAHGREMLTRLTACNHRGTRYGLLHHWEAQGTRIDQEP